MLALQVNLAVEVGPHEGVLRVHVVPRHAHVLVHAKRSAVLERQRTCLVHRCEVLEYAATRRSGGDGNHEERFARSGFKSRNFGRQIFRCPAHNSIEVRFDDKPHVDSREYVFQPLLMQHLGKSKLATTS